MSKNVFWPLTLALFGVIMLASFKGLIPVDLLHLWPLILITVGLGGLFLSDRDEWMSESAPKTMSGTKSKSSSTRASRPSAKRTTATKKKTVSKKRAPVKRKSARRKTTKK